MSKAYTKEKLGTVQGSLVSPNVYPIPHSPEEEKRLQTIVEQIRPYLTQSIQENINLYLEQNIDQGDIILYLIQYIRNFFNTYNQIIGPSYTGGDGIEVDSNVINVDEGNGLTISSGKVVAEANASAAIEVSASGIAVNISDSLDTTGDGGGLSFDGEDGVRVAPEDFLATEYPE